MTSYYNRDELSGLGLKSFGANVCISRKASFYETEKIRIGDSVRIDDFCILSGRVVLGNYIHVAPYSAIFGGDAGVVVEDFANISSRTCVYAINDDYSGETMTNPLVPEEYKNVCQKEVRIGRHVIIGSGSTVLPGVVIGEGAAVGACSLIKSNLEPWGIYAGVPCKRIKKRSDNLLKLEREFLLQKKRREIP